jgi:hypothetical protein
MKEIKKVENKNITVKKGMTNNSLNKNQNKKNGIKK